jgi:LuxR family maltose regulon positive regulatory protein
MSTTKKPFVEGDVLFHDGNTILVNSNNWFNWVSENNHFSYKGKNGNFVARKEKRRNTSYWYAFRRIDGKLHKVYMGRSEELSLLQLEEASFNLAGKAMDEAVDYVSDKILLPEPEPRIDTSFVPLTKVNVPVLPQMLVSRTRLTSMINTPLTLIYAPSGFGKSTLLNDWQQTCGFPVAWLSLDDSDNHPVRFCHSLIMALQVVSSDIGKEEMSLLYDRSVPPAELLIHISNNISKLGIQRLGLILDDFHRIKNAELNNAIQQWVIHLPSSFQLILSGHIKPALSLGNLRAKGMVIEIDADDLRFTQEEGINYLKQYPQDPPLAYHDLEKLVKHTEGWAAGLTLAALAMYKQEDRREFIDSFSGAHIYLREYFLEAVLQRLPPDVQTFLLKTSILKNMTGSLCNAITGRSDGAAMLLKLWQDNIFIVRMDQIGWYRYHDLFAEMLYSQLQNRFPEEVSDLHKRAAHWYRDQMAPTDAINHLIATEAWEEAASLIEETALRELEQFGEDSRLLRWLEELPVSIVQRHKNLLFVYLRLANIAHSKRKIEKFIGYIEQNLSNKPAALLTQDERDVLYELQQIRHTWGEGHIYIPQTTRKEKWDLLNRIHILKVMFISNVDELTLQISNLYYEAKIKKNLFVIMMAGGVLSRHYYYAGKFRRSEIIAREVLHLAMSMRGTLPEPASISLSVLTQIYLERNDIKLAQKYLEQAIEVDPNPTSSNMLIQNAILRAEIQAAMGQFEEASLTVQAMKEYQFRQPAGMWVDQDVLANAAMIYAKIDLMDHAEENLHEIGEMNKTALAKFVSVFIDYKKGAYSSAEQKIDNLIKEYPSGIFSEVFITPYILQASILFEQHNLNQAYKVLVDVIRQAAPERVIRPFLDYGISAFPLLDLILETENLSVEAQAFVKELIKLFTGEEDFTKIEHKEFDNIHMHTSITSREQEILALVNAGYTNRDLAQQLSISESTVKTHLSNIYSKLEVSSRVQAVSRAKALKLIE